MTAFLQSRYRHRLFAGQARPRLELLEGRDIPSVSPLQLVETGPNETLDHAQTLGDLSAQPQIDLSGTIGNDGAGATDVDWYSFTLDHAATVSLSATGNGGADPILGVYNSDLNDYGDPFTPTHHRLLGQTPDGGNTATFTLGAGTYYAAVSGAGNRYFYPFLAGSGSQGAEGAYTLTLSASDLPQQAGAGPAVLSTDPAPGATLTSSPFAIRVNFDKPIDPSTICLDQTVLVTYNANGTFGDGNDTSVNLSSYNLSSDGTELQLFPAAALQPGSYRVTLLGDTSASVVVLADPNGLPIGSDATHPTGQDYSFSFRVTGVEGHSPTAPADDTAPYANELGVLTADQPVQQTGAIGDDPFYDLNNPNSPGNPSADVDLYHFQIDGPGRYAFTAEVMAGRIGSSLDAGLSLFRLDPSTGQLVFVAGINDTRNASLATDGTLPLNADPALFQGLTAGDYYVAVSANYNTPTSAPGNQPGMNGIFDPNISHSGTAGFSTGPYVLALGIHEDDVPPTVTSTSLTASSTLDTPPTTLSVGFSEPVNLSTLVYSAYDATSQLTVSAVYIQAADGTKYFPRIQGIDSSTNIATFLMLDGLPNGNYELHLSGSLGLTDFAGNPLVGNDVSGDYVVPFTVAAPSRGVNGDPLNLTATEPSDLSNPQNLGTLFPHDLQSGISITRVADPTATDTGNAFQFTVLQSQTYGFTLDGANLPAGVHLELDDTSGNPVNAGSFNGGVALTSPLDPGTYILRVDGWTPADASTIAYEVRFVLVGSSDNAPALTVGPSQAVQMRLVGTAPISADLVQLAPPPAQPTPAPDTGTPTPAGVASTTPVQTAPVTAARSTLPQQPIPVTGVQDPDGASPSVIPELMPTLTILNSSNTNISSTCSTSKATTSSNNRSVNLPTGLLAPLSGPPVGNLSGTFPAATPEPVSRFILPIQDVSPALVVSLNSFLDLNDLPTEMAAIPEDAGEKPLVPSVPTAPTLPPVAMTRPQVAASQRLVPKPVQRSLPAVAVKEEPPQVSTSIPSPASSPAVAEVAIAEPETASAESGGLGVWGWVIALSTGAVPLLMRPWRMLLRARRSVSRPGL